MSLPIDFAAAGFVVNRAGATSAESESGTAVVGALLLSRANVPGITMCLGSIAVAAGAVSVDAVCHETGEVMYVLAGRGELRTDRGAILIAKGDAVFIPVCAWHWLANTGADELISVFAFPEPDRPAGQRRLVGEEGNSTE